MNQAQKDMITVVGKVKGYMYRDPDGARHTLTEEQAAQVKKAKRKELNFSKKQYLYLCKWDSGKKDRLTKDELEVFIRGKAVRNAKMQIYKGTLIIRVAEDKDTTHGKLNTSSTASKQTFQGFNALGSNVIQ